MHNHGKTMVSTGELPNVLLLGNPNVGKSVIFGVLTGHYVEVSNYPGTTVELTSGTATLNRRKYSLIDTPGINNLIPMSEDERVTRDILLHETFETVVLVGDAKNLRRALLIAIQLAEMGLPFVLVLNMTDEARERRIFINTAQLGEMLGIDVVSTVATHRQGLDQLSRSVSSPRISQFQLTYDQNIEQGVSRLEALLPEALIAKRSLALMLLSGDVSLKPWLMTAFKSEAARRMADIEEAVDAVQALYSEPLGYLVNQLRYAEAERIFAIVSRVEGQPKSTLAMRLGRWTVHPVWGLPLLLLVLFIMYEIVGVFGAGTLVGLLEENFFGQILNPAVTYLVGFIPVELVRDLIAGEYGLFTMALTYSIGIILPVVGTFFICFGILEDSGYLPRLATMVDRLFRIMGLNGKAVLPMVLGLGCDTMATLTTRILESRKERVLVTLLLALAVPCSAQLAVILAMLGGMSILGAFLWAAIIVIVLFAVGALGAKLVPGSPSDFVLEIPPLRIPKFSNVLIKTVARVEWYLKEAVPLFIYGTLILFVLDKVGALLFIEQAASPIVVNFLGLPPKATDAFLVGFLRRDYGAAGLYALVQDGQMDQLQALVSLVTITLFVPCIAQFMVTIKERGMRTALLIAGFIVPFAFLVGGVLNFVLRYLGVVL